MNLLHGLSGLTPQNIRACVWYNQKGQETPVKGLNCRFSPSFFQMQDFKNTLLPKWHVFLEFSVEKKMALLAGTTQNKWLKKVLTPVLASVPKGSILGLLFFLIYINDH